MVRRLESQPIDLLINNTALGMDVSELAKVKIDELEQLLRGLNVLGPMQTTQALLPNLRAGRGRIIVGLSSSNTAIFSAAWLATTYC